MEFTPVEDRLMDGLKNGGLTDLLDGRELEQPLTESVVADWGDQHEVRAEALRAMILLHQKHSDVMDPRGLRLRGARLSGRLNLDYATIAVPLVLTECHLPEGISAISSSCVLLDLGGSLIVGSAQSGAAVDLDGAQISQGLWMGGTTLKNPDGPALYAYGIHVDFGVFLGQGFRAEGNHELGAVHVREGDVGGQLNLGSATLINPAGPALHADGLQVRGPMYLNDRFRADGYGDLGAVALVDGRVGGQLDMQGATLLNRSGPALSADRLHVGANMEMSNGFRAEGQGEAGVVRLNAARVVGQLSLRGGTLRNSQGPALDGEDLQVTGAVFLDEGFRAEGFDQFGALRLVAAHVGAQLNVDVRSVSGRWNVDGLTYSGIPSCGTRAWLALLTEQTVQYAPQPYQHLANAARSIGHDREARSILMRQREDQLARGDVGFAEYVWGRITGWTLGYGYQPWRTLIGLGLVLVAALALTLWIAPAGLTPTADDALSSTVTVAPLCDVSDRILYGIDIAVPLIDTGVTDRCDVSANAAGTLVTWVGLGLRLISWALAALFIAGFTSAIRKT